MVDSRRHLYIPDTQIKPGVNINHLNALGHYILDQRPDVIIQAGDWADMHSLSSYDKGKKSAEGVRYEEDIRSSKRGMQVLMQPIREYNNRCARNKRRQYKPRFIITIGNHENRINRYVEDNPVFDGKLCVGDLGFREAGWEMHDFLDVVEVDGIQYSHYFPRSASGRVMQNRRGAPSAATQVKREMCSSTSGHLQGLDYHIHTTGTKRFYGLIAGAFYTHDEKYLTSQGTAYWRGVVVKNEVKNGEYDACFVSINYLLNRWWDGNNYVA